MAKIAESDVFGRQLLANYNGFPTETLERDDGRIDTWSADYYFSHSSSWRPEIISALKTVDGIAVDVGCGAGRHALYLQEQGVAVTAIDKSPGAVEVARLRGVRDARCADIEAMNKAGDFGGKVNTFVMLGSNLGLLQSPEKASAILETMHSLGRQGTRIIGEGLDPYVSADPDHITYCAANRAKKRAYGSRVLRTLFQQEAGEWFNYLALSPEELGNISQQSGWRLGAVDQEAGGRYIAVLERL